MPRRRRHLRFAWWNLHDFAHFDPARISRRKRWPAREGQYEAKRDRVLAACDELFGGRYPDLLGVCEITRPAAADLLARLPSGYELAVLPDGPGDDFQVAVYFRPSAGLTREPLLIPFGEADVPRRTRPMIPLHHTGAGYVVRFVFCHWPGMGERSSGVYRGRLADFLRRNSYEFLCPPPGRPAPSRHLVVIGDLNAEPTADLFDGPLVGTRDRATSRQPRHSSDADVRRVRLYNAAWKYLGEQVPHRGTPRGPEVAGTYYGDKLGWQSFDHVLVTGGLLGSDLPFLDEAETRIIWTTAMLDGSGRPAAFDPDDPAAGGVSDHLPLVGRIRLP